MRVETAGTNVSPQEQRLLCQVRACRYCHGCIDPPNRKDICICIVTVAIAAASTAVTAAASVAVTIAVAVAVFSVVADMVAFVFRQFMRLMVMCALLFVLLAESPHHCCQIVSSGGWKGWWEWEGQRCPLSPPQESP